MSTDQDQQVNQQPPAIIEDLEPISTTGTIQMQDETKGKVVLENGTTLLFTRQESSTLYIQQLTQLEQTLRIDEPLPTQILFPKQNEEDLKLAGEYISGIRKMVALMMKHGSSASIKSYSFRLPHFNNYDEWLNVVVRLQFANALNAIRRTLNDNLVSKRRNKWGVLDINDKGEFTINGKVVPFGTKVDVFTTRQKVLTEMTFSSHAQVNCAEIDGATLPVFHYNKEDLNNIDYESMEKRKQAAVSATDHMLGVDAFSFLNGLLWRVSDGKDDIVDVDTDILTETDRDPALNVRDYNNALNELNEMDLPYGLNNIAIVGYKNYYSKRLSRANGFVETMREVQANAKSFRRKFEKLTKDKPEMIIGIFDIFRLLAGPRSRVLKITGVRADGTLVDLITTNRNMVLEPFKAFNRFNTQPAQFFELEYVKKKAKKKEKAKHDPDYFKSSGVQVSANELVGFIHSSAKIYYWDNNEQPRPQDPVDSKNLVALFSEMKVAFSFSERDEL